MTQQANSNGLSVEEEEEILEEADRQRQIRNTSKSLFVKDYVERGKSYTECQEDYSLLSKGRKIAPTYWDKKMRDFNAHGGDRNEASESIIKDIKLKSEQEPEEKEEEEEWECGQCGMEGKGQPPAHCPGCGIEFNLE